LGDGDLADLSPVPAADQALDAQLRRDLGVPDERYFVVFQAASEERALEVSEALAGVLRGCQGRGEIGGFDVPSETLPSARTQLERRAALPDAGTLRARLEAALAAVPGVEFVDLNRESDALLLVFQGDATRLAVVGSLAILGVLAVGLRSVGRVVAVAAPLAGAVIVTAAILTLGGRKLSIFMVVGFLLIVAVGSNYGLFFARREPEAGRRERAAASILLANLCTVSAYGLMSVSRIPVLHDIGMTVAMGTFLSMIFGAVLSTPGRAL
jgi:predicted exporter